MAEDLNLQAEIEQLQNSNSESESSLVENETELCDEPYLDMIRR